MPAIIDRPDLRDITATGQLEDECERLRAEPVEYREAVREWVEHCHGHWTQLQPRIAKLQELAERDRDK